MLEENGFTRISTRGLPAAQRFDFWREAHNLIDIDVPAGAARAGFNADLLLYAVSGAMTFGHVSNDDTVTRFANSDQEFILLSQTLSGSVEMKTKQGGSFIATPLSGLVVADGSRHLETRSRNHEHVYLTLPRSMLANLSAASLLERDGFCVLPSEGLPGLLMSHMTQVAKEHQKLSADAATTAIKAAVDMALMALDLAGSDHALTLSERRDPALMDAAIRYVELHLQEPDLTAGKIAAALNCSRAHLYRAFVQNDETIGEALRIARLKRASTLLVVNPTWPVEKVAGLCGFTNASAFIRTFRRQYGMTPGSFRNASLTYKP